MADIEWPRDLSPFRASFFLRPHVGGVESPLTRTRKTYLLSKPVWVCRLSFRGGWDGEDGKAALGARMDSLIVQMQGGFNRVLLWDFRRPYPVGLRRYYSQFSGETYTFADGRTFSLGERFFVPAEAEPINELASAGATSIVFGGFLPGERTFQTGDYFGGDGRSHIIHTATVADEDGRTMLTFDPPLQSALGVGQAITMRPTTPFKLSTDSAENAGNNDSDVGSDLVEYQLDFVEDLP
ncbi:hypothetical protein IP68_02165 [Blastomonas sp. AAP25]|uniref:hypothetical protein n=1 Tax=Blastomonas sp. AAP25 TaxID=1523416 RepID=UPI0006B8AD08|nr:hypothetical protein [Blastomonas sp. AAP25]KPF76723.1 hypothetical protein IP68_02165 [Blastomonas sp. AAP25]